MAGRRAGILVDGVQRAIVIIRGQRVMLDADLAALYGFPTDFMFRLTPGEGARLRSQFVTSNQPRGRGGRRSAPYAFTEQGVAMLSSVLRSRRAIEVNIAIMRTFVRLRQ